MKVQEISKVSLAVFLDNDELTKQGLDVNSINYPRASSLARQAFSAAGIKVNGSIEVDTFAGNSGVMLFAYVRQAVKDVYELFYFDCLDDAISGICELNELSCQQASLAFWDNKYYLALHSNDSYRGFSVLEEFGTRCSKPELKFALISEHNGVICAGNAIEKITKAFKK